MAKAATVQARVDMQLKVSVDKILKQIGMSASQVINALYAQIVMQKGVPFEIKIPNQHTMDAIEELESGNGITVDSFSTLLNDVDGEDG